MIYLIGGCIRSGKTTLVKRLLANAGIPHFNLDALVNAAIELNVLGMNHELSGVQRAAILKPILFPLIKNLDHQNDHYALDGIQLRSAYIHELIGDRPENYRAVVLGYPEATVEHVLSCVRGANNQEREWLLKRSPEDQHRLVDLAIEQSRSERDMCHKLGIPFVSTHPGFEAGIETAMNCLLGGKHDRS